ncbi:MAG: adenylate/guanylate cyclase domain-containing protein [Alphaproteobacteria bacterium]
MRRGLDAEAIFSRERVASTRLAMLGRLGVIAAIAIWISLTRNPPLVYYTLGACALFAAITALHYRLVPSYAQMRWLPYVFYGLDVAMVIAGIALSILIFFDHVPPAMVYHFNYFPFFFLVLISTGMSLSPRVVLWTGACIVAGWLMLYLVVDHPAGLDWDDIPADARGDDFLAYILSSDWVGGFSRIQESIVILATAGILSLIVYRARRLVARQIEAEQSRRAVREAFGQYVPDTVADAMIATGGILPPEQRRASVLFCDLTGFTAMTHRLGPERTVAVLNDYFDCVAACIGRHGGIITQFQGDAALAVFNAPTDLADHERSALNAAREILESCAGSTFGGQEMIPRIGIATGELVAGTVGGAGRRGYTVHGDTVNLAARLEAKNKDQGTRILLSAETAAALGEGEALRAIENVSLPGVAEPVTVYTPTH